MEFSAGMSERAFWTFWACSINHSLFVWARHNGKIHHEQQWWCHESFPRRKSSRNNWIWSTDEFRISLISHIINKMTTSIAVFLRICEIQYWAGCRLILLLRRNELKLEERLRSRGYCVCIKIAIKVIFKAMRF